MRDPLFKKIGIAVVVLVVIAAIGMAEGSFEIRLRGKKSDAFNKSVDEIKATFGGVKVEVK